MDMFMDKLAQKFTAQEIIRGNLAAEAEEMDTLKTQVKDYEECLEQVKALSSMMEDKLAVIKSMDNMPEIEEEFNRLKRNMDLKLGDLAVMMDEKIGARLDELPDTLNQNLEQNLNQKFETSKENMHKECVKVYRNVQAVVVDESGKQLEAQNESIRCVRSAARKSVIFSLLAMIAAIACLLMQLANWV